MKKTKVVVVTRILTSTTVVAVECDDDECDAWAEVQATQQTRHWPDGRFTHVREDRIPKVATTVFAPPDALESPR